MRMVLALLCLVTLSATEKRKRQPVQEWNYKVDEKKGTKGCSNLTLVLDNWKFAIMTQVKDLLLHDHGTVLPEYRRILPLSEAMGDLYLQFKTLKEHLGKLTSRFDGVEAFVDDIQTGKVHTPPRVTSSAVPLRRLRRPYMPPTPVSRRGRQSGILVGKIKRRKSPQT